MIEGIVRSTPGMMLSYWRGPAVHCSWSTAVAEPAWKQLLPRAQLYKHTNCSYDVTYGDNPERYVKTALRPPDPPSAEPRQSLWA